jgi:Ca2+-binding EF-hand superfamily protein
MANIWDSVRKAFLDLDMDHDGYISDEDIMKYFGNVNEININDLKKLLKDKDSTRRGYLSYQDFSSWVGNSIHLI